MVVGWLNIYPYNPLTQLANQPPFFEIFIFNHPTNMVTFDDLWRIFLDRGALATQRAETASFWAQYTPEQQQKIYDNIRRKLAANKFIHYTPRIAICENAPRKYNPTEPTNYNGSPDLNRMAENNDMVVALYDGTAGIYTKQDAEDYGMDIKRPFKL